jgi:hypothetical protein
MSTMRILTKNNTLAKSNILTTEIKLMHAEKECTASLLVSMMITNNRNTVQTLISSALCDDRRYVYVVPALLPSIFVVHLEPDGGHVT